jgi:hypothetical protein
MKNLAIAVMASLFLFASCGKKSEGTHTHDDGSTHADHVEDSAKQEEFNVTDSTEHQHEDSAEHSHPHPH